MKAIDHTINGKCSSCGLCCGDLLPLTPFDIKRVKRYVKKHNIQELNKGNVFSSDMTCPFRDQEAKKCNVYEARPEICRAYICNISADEMDYKHHGKATTKSMKYAIYGNTENKEYESILKV